MHHVCDCSGDWADEKSRVSYFDASRAIAAWSSRMKLFERLQWLDGNQKENTGAAEPVKSTAGFNVHIKAHMVLAA